MWASSGGGSGGGSSAAPVGLTTNVGGKPVTRVFGQPLDPESGNAPGSLLKLIQYIQKRGKNTPGLFRKPSEDIRKEVEALRKGVMLEKDGLQVATYTNSPFTAAEVMRQLLEALPDPLLTCDLYDSFLIALTFTELEDRLDYWRLLLAALPPGFKATTEKTLSILHLLHTHSTGQFPANGNYAHNLGPIFAPVFLRPRALGPYMAHDAKLTADVVQNLIEHMPSLFDPAQMSTIQNTPRRQTGTPVSTPMKLAALPRSLRSSAPSSPTLPPRPTTTLPSSSPHSLSSLMPEHKYPKMPPIVKPPTPKRRRHAETAVPKEGGAPQGEPADQEKEPVLATEGAVEIIQDAIVLPSGEANGTAVHGGAEEDSADQTATQEQLDDQAEASDEHVEETKREAEPEDNDKDNDNDNDNEEDSGDTAESVDLSGQYDNDDDMTAAPGGEIRSKEKGLEEQVARIERACEDLTCHLYDVAMTFDRAVTTARSLRTLCEDIAQFFQRMELELPQGYLSDEEAVSEDEHDESKLLLLITQIKHFMGQAQANTQLIVDAYEQTDVGELERRRLLASFVQEVATRVHAVVHPVVRPTAHGGAA